MAAEPSYPLASAASQLPCPAAPPADRLSSNRLSSNQAPSPPSPSPPKSTPLGRVARLGLVALAFVGAVVFDVPLCPFALLTRHPCPGCGLTRGTLALVRGHVGEALRFHQLVPVVTPLVALALGWNAISYVRHGRWAAAEGLRGRWITRAAALLGAAMLAVWVARFLGAFGGPVAV
jgi:hypothetical protein